MAPISSEMEVVKSPVALGRNFEYRVITQRLGSPVIYSRALFELIDTGGVNKAGGIGSEVVFNIGHRTIPATSSGVCTYSSRVESNLGSKLSALAELAPQTLRDADSVLGHFAPYELKASFKSGDGALYLGQDDGDGPVVAMHILSRNGMMEYREQVIAGALAVLPKKLFGEVPGNGIMVCSRTGRFQPVVGLPGTALIEYLGGDYSREVRTDRYFHTFPVDWNPANARNVVGAIALGHFTPVVVMSS